MRLNMQMLEDVLSTWRFIGKNVDPWQRRTCTHPLLALKPQERYVEGPLYVTRAECLLDQPVLEGHPSLLVVGEPPRSWVDSPCNLLWSNEDMDVESLANAVSAQFARYQEWADVMGQVVDRGGTPSELAACCDGILGNPIYAMGPEMYLICSYTPRVEPDTPEYAAYRERYHMDYGVYEGPEVVVDSLTMEDYFELEPTPLPSLTRSPFGHDVLYHTIYLHEVPLATVCVDGIASPITDRDRILSVVWGEHLLKLLSGEAGRFLRQGRLGGEVFHGLLDHVLQPERRIQGFLRLRSWEDDDEYLCCVVRNNTSGDPTLLGYLALSIARNVGGVCHEVRDDRVVLAFCLTRAGKAKEELIKELMALMARRDVTISYSRTFIGFRNVWYFYQQALCAERLGSRLDPTLWLFNYEDYELADMIERICRVMPAATFAPEGLLRLVCHDEERDGVYVDTLRTYLECERNVAETSRRLFVHRNTFLYRLTRIEELLGMDLDDPDVRLTLQLALRMVR